MDILKKILPLIGLTIFIFLFFKYIKFYSLGNIVKTINIKFFFLSMMSTFFILFFKIYRVYKILKLNEIKINGLEFFEVYTNTNILSQITNILFTEATTATITMHNQNSKARIGNIFFTVNFLDFVVIFSLLIFSSFFYFNILSSFLIIKKFIFVVLFFFFAIIVALLLTTKFKNYFFKIISDLKYLLKNSIKEIVFYTFLVYFFYVISIYFETKTFNLNMNFVYFLMVYTLGSLVTVLPISINGLGTREAVFIFLLKMENINSEVSFLLSLYAYVFLPLISLFLLYFAILTIKSFKNCKKCTH